MAAQVESDTTNDGGNRMNNPLVSIIIPTYNYAHLIAETLQSVVQQSYSHWECIIVDDGSADNTEQVVTDFIAVHPKFNLQYLHTTNGGTSAAKNRGISLARGKYIQFLDADDLLSPAKLSIQVPLMEKQQAALVFSSSQFFSISGGEQIAQQKYPEGFLATATLSEELLMQRLVTNNIVTIASPLASTQLIRSCGGFESDLHNNEDWLLWFQLALIQPVFIFDNESVSFTAIRIHGSSAMTNHTNMFLGEVRVRQQMELLLLEKYGDKHHLVKMNRDLLALHRVRSLEINKGMSYIITNFIQHPVNNYPLLAKGLFKLCVRFYKSLFHR